MMESHAEDDSPGWTGKFNFEMLGARSARKAKAREEESEPEPSLWDDDGFFDEDEEIQFGDDLIEFLIGENGVGLLTGSSGAYKTFNAVRMCVSIAARKDFAGFKVERPGGCAYLGYEGQETVKPRLMAALKDLGLTMGRVPVVAPKGPETFNQREAYDKLEAALKRINRKMLSRFGVPLVFVCIDTAIAAGMIKDEHNPGEWQVMFSNLKAIAIELDIAIAVVAHAGKDASKGARGSSGSYAAADFELTFSAAKDNITGDVSGRLISLTKSRDGATFPIAAMSGESVYVGKTRKGKRKESMVMRYDTSRDAIDRALGEQAAQAAKAKGEGKGKSKSLNRYEQAIMDVVEHALNNRSLAVHDARTRDGDESSGFLESDVKKAAQLKFDTSEMSAARMGLGRAIKSLVRDKKITTNGGLLSKL
ncbi:AAA family ATPase [Agrobacterium tumefaciens]|nr:AAA family ATPase [Agrobacterium tumefaciens]NTE53507.1 AAA family ATPase [Agrobacterium tumefaciens]NTE70980.1 AAA family ATPase [Agrobacterium tumefaciens]OCJ68095.1 hypothetical protein A6U97_05245 [Agrobacterium tumefaciens]WCK13902.1 AAA family ATPase [Agrobacterium tumefaciens]